MYLQKADIANRHAFWLHYGFILHWWQLVIQADNLLINMYHEYFLIESYKNPTLLLLFNFLQVQFGLGVRIETLEEQMTEMGSSVAQVESLAKEFEKIEEESQASLHFCVV